MSKSPYFTDFFCFVYSYKYEYIDFSPLCIRNMRNKKPPAMRVDQ